MTDQPLAPGIHPAVKAVSRIRRAAFAFGMSFGCAISITLMAWFKAPVNEVTTTAEHVLSDMGVFIGLAYIGGSVVDYTGMFKSLGNRFGISIPFMPGPAPAAASDDASDGKVSS
jgi:hypothetical protein